MYHGNESLGLVWDCVKVRQIGLFITNSVLRTNSWVWWNYKGQIGGDLFAPALSPQSEKG